MAKILDTKSSHIAESGKDSSPSLISNEKLVAIYTAMIRCRMLQQRTADLFQQGKLNADLHASSGRVASAASVGVDLQPEDTLSIATGDWLPAFLKGLPAETIFRALAPRVATHPKAVIEEAQKRNILVHEDGADQPLIVLDIAEALGAAQKPAIVVAFLQPAADSASRWQKVISLAADKKLPIIFVEHIVDGSSRSASPRGRNKSGQALIHGVPAIAVDAADPVALYRVSCEAITRARQSRGATLLECASFPIINAEDPATKQPLQPPDPIFIMETFLKGKGIEPEPYNREVVAGFSQDLDLATRFLLS